MELILCSLRLLRTGRARLVEDIGLGLVKVVTVEIDLEINLENVMPKNNRCM